MTRVTRMTQQWWLLAGVTMAAVSGGCTGTDTVMMQHPLQRLAKAIGIPVTELLG